MAPACHRGLTYLPGARQEPLELPRKSTATIRERPPSSGKPVVTEEAIFPSQTEEITDNRG